MVGSLVSKFVHGINSNIHTHTHTNALDALYMNGKFSCVKPLRFGDLSLIAPRVIYFNIVLKVSSE